MADEEEFEAQALRPSEVTRLRSLLLERRSGLTICGVSGPGGIGKSYLVDHVLSSLEGSSDTWVKLRIDAAQEEARGDFLTGRTPLALCGPLHSQASEPVGRSAVPSIRWL